MTEKIQSVRTWCPKR